MIKIRKAVSSDSDSIVQFQLDLAIETEDYKLDRPTVEKGVERVFIDNTKGEYYVAEVDSKVVGSLLTTYEWSDWRNGTTLWIQSVYVHKKYRGMGVYKTLYKHLKDLIENDPAYT